MRTPFFPVWRARLAPLGRRVQQLRQHSLVHLDELFGPWLPPELLAQADEGPNSRDRVFNVRRTFFGFLYQVLNPHCPCREVVRQIQALFALHHDGPVDSGSSAYCQARARLPWDILPRLRQAAAHQADQTAQRWRGLWVKVVDGTGLSLPDTPENQRAYPQSSAQKPGCGFPLLKIVAIFSLASGALLAYARGHKRQHELPLLHRLLDQVKPGDLVLADRGFSVYTLLALLWGRGVHGLFRLHHARAADFRRGKRLGPNDRLLTWFKPHGWQRRRYLGWRLWNRIAAQLSVRMVRVTLAVPGFRTHSVTLVTTLLDPVAYPAEELARLYLLRWRIELWFRDIKTAMGMEVLRCQTPPMIHKELEMFLIAYNLMRCLLTQASQAHDVALERLSFKGAVDSVRQFSAAIAQARSKKKQRQLIAQLLAVIAHDPVPDRPGRREPRAVKRRPKPFADLNRPRHQFSEVGHRNRHWKNKAKNP
jgi:Transposase DDE domain